MKYIKKFVCELSDNVVISESRKSDSVYITLDDGFVVRLSDHESVMPNSVSLDIISLWKRKDFLLFVGPTHIPLVKTREELKNHIKITHENWLLNKLKRMSDVKNNTKPVGEAPVIQFGKCKTVEDFITWNGASDSYDMTSLDVRSLMATVRGGRSISKSVREYLLKQVIDKRITIAELLAIIIKYNGFITTNETAGQAIENYLKQNKSIAEADRNEPGQTGEEEKV